MDIALLYNSNILAFDLFLAEANNKDLKGDNGLLTAIIISLFTDARAKIDDLLPDERIGQTIDMRGWWGDKIANQESSLGSRLWLLSREKDMNVVIIRAEQYATEALEWLVTNKLVSSLKVTASRVQTAYLGIAVELLPINSNNEVTREWNFVYDYQNSKAISIRN